MSSYPKPWDDDMVSEHIKQESQQKSPDVFLKTHIPIRKIRAEQLYGSDDAGGFIDEEHLFEHLTQSSPERAENRIYMLKGEVGSGKSHVCQWLEYQINGRGDLEGARDHVAIHISRNSTRLADILEKLYEHIGIEHDELADLAELDAEDLADFIISGLRTFGANTERFSGFELEKFIRDYEHKLDLRTVLTENIIEYQEAIAEEDREQRIDLISREEFGRVCFNAFGETFDESDVYPVIRNAIHDRLIKNVGIEDFQSELVKVANQYQQEGKRPVLIAEDVTTFTVLKDDLLDYIFQLGDGEDEMQSGFDVILGYTTGWEAEQADDALITGDLSFMTQRAVGYLSLTNENGEAYFLEDGPMPVRLVKKYLSVIKDKSGREAGNVDEDAFDGLYPFNERLIVRAYRNLQEQGKRQQTPRLLLYHVIGDCLRSTLPPHNKLGGNTYIADFHDPTSSDFDPAVNHILKWYGKLEDGSVVVPRACFETFGVDVPQDAQLDDGQVAVEAKFMSGGWEVPDRELQGDHITGQVDKEGPDIGSDSKDETDDVKIEDEPGTGGSSSGGPSEDGPGRGDSGGDDSDKYPEAQKAIAHFKDWYGAGSEFPSSERLKDGVQTALNQFSDPTRLANPNATTDGTAGFYYARGSDVPVEIRGADTSKNLAVTVSPFADGHPGYERMLYHLTLYPLEAPKTDASEFPPETNFDTVRAWGAGQVQTLRRQMRNELEDALGDELKLEQFVVLASYLLLNGERGTTEVDPGLLLRDPGEFAVESSSPFKRTDRNEPRENPVEVPASLHSAYDALATRSEQIMNLSQGFFLLKSGFVDHERFEPARTYVAENIENCLSAAARISADEVPDAYRVGTTRNSAQTRVSTLFEAVSNYANELRKFHESFESSALTEEIETVKTLYSPRQDIDKVQEVYGRLVDCLGPIDTTMQRSWEQAGTILDDRPDELDLSKFGMSLNTLESEEPGLPVETLSLLETYNESKDTQPAWTVYEVIEELLTEVEDQPQPDIEGLAQQVRESNEFEQFQRQRDRTLEAIGGI